MGMCILDYHKWSPGQTGKAVDSFSFILDFLTFWLYWEEHQL